MTNAQHANENLTIHIKVKDYATWRPAYEDKRRTASPQVSRMGECSATPKTRMTL